MGSDPRLPDDLIAAVGAPVVAVQRASGGSISAAWLLECADGTRRFAKTLPTAPVGFFAAEARGLAWLAEAGALPTPRVHGHTPPDAPGGFLLLEAIAVGGPTGGRSWEALGRGLAALHRAHPDELGLDHDNFIGRLPQPNRAAPGWDWPTFYVERRLRPQVDRAQDRGLLDIRLRRTLDRVLSRVPALVGPPEPPARLHGDLWSGNVVFDIRGQPWLIDPAVAGGHRELDLAMMRLFGGFPERAFAAYGEAYPLAPGATERVDLYQLYYLLVHLNLFGARYRGSVAAAAGRYV